MLFFLPTKHIPILFQREGDSGMILDATLYLDKAVFQSIFDCVMDPSAKRASELRGLNMSALPSCSKAI
uniref:Uncharacterized protein n=1 Tax=Lepeophtheirus salmonis TaxID=72036 RepID=A0A0K2UHX0_LEPSM